MLGMPLNVWGIYFLGLFIGFLFGSGVAWLMPVRKKLAIQKAHIDDLRKIIEDELRHPTRIQNKGVSHGNGSDSNTAT